jgi:hypothetical protein
MWYEECYVTAPADPFQCVQTKSPRDYLEETVARVKQLLVSFV